MVFRHIWSFLQEVAEGYSRARGARLAAALAYYAAFSLAPLLVIATSIAALFLRQERVMAGLIEQVYLLAGDQVAQFVETVLEHASRPGAGALAFGLGLIVLLVGAANLFAQLQDALNTIWGIRARSDGGVLALVRRRFFTFLLALVSGLLLFMALAASAALSAVNHFFTGLLPGAASLWSWLNQIVFFVSIVLAFSLLFKYLPDAHVRWRDAWIGAVVTTLLFSLGKVLIGLYLAHSSISSAYGAAGSLAVALIWLYYSAQILLLGAEFTRVYARRYGRRIRPNVRGVSIPYEKELRARLAAEAALRRQIRLHYAARRAAELKELATRTPDSTRRPIRVTGRLAGFGLAVSALLGAMALILFRRRS